MTKASNADLPVKCIRELIAELILYSMYLITCFFVLKVYSMRTAKVICRKHQALLWFALFAWSSRFNFNNTLYAFGWQKMAWQLDWPMLFSDWPGLLLFQELINFYNSKKLILSLMSVLSSFQLEILTYNSTAPAKNMEDICQWFESKWKSEGSISNSKKTPIATADAQKIKAI